MSACPVQPCATCPWRRSSTVGGADIPGFSIDKMRGLANTVPGPGDRGDGFRPIMACHGTAEGAEGPCRGYLARHGWSNLAVRIMAIEGRVPLEAIADAADGLDLYDSFHEMLHDYEVAHNWAALAAEAGGQR